MDRSIPVCQFEGLAAMIAMADLLGVDASVLWGGVFDEIERADGGVFDRMRGDLLASVGKDL